MKISFFTQDVWMFSPTYHELLKDSRIADPENWPEVKMTAEITIGDEYNGDISIRIQNKMWADPQKYPDEPESEGEYFSLFFDLSDHQAYYLMKYLEATFNYKRKKKMLSRKKKKKKMY